MKQVLRSGSAELARLSRVGLVQVLNEQGKYNDALTRIKELLPTSEATEKASLTWQQMRALLGVNKPKDANERFRELAAAAPPAITEADEFLILRNLVAALIKAGEVESALALQERVAPLLREESWRQEWLLARADLCASSERLLEAASLFQSFVELYPRDERRFLALFSAAVALARQGESDRALGLYGKLLADDTAPLAMRYHAGYNQALVQRDQKKNTEAAIKTLQVLQGLPLAEEPMARTHFTLAEIHLQRDEARPAADLYGEVCNLQPKTDLARLSRFRQAVALSQTKAYGQAARTFAQFLTEWPNDAEFAADATYRQGQAEFLAGAFSDARATFQGFIRDFPDSPLVPRVLAEASNAAAAGDLTKDAIDLLTELLSKYKEGDEVAWALYRRAYLRMAAGFASEALSDSYEFLRLHGTTRPVLAANVYFWLGDYYQGQGKFNEAETHYLKIPELYPETKDAPVALYAAARVAYERAMADNQNPVDLARAAALLLQLDDRYAKAADRLKAQALFLSGDILSLKGDFKAAALQFEAASRLVPRTSLHYAALGRKAECHALLATKGGEDRAKQYDQALALLQQIIDADGAGETLAALKTKASYRKARILEGNGERTKAITEYDMIFHSFRAPYNLKFDWYYFSRAGFDLARLYQQDQQYSHALQIYRAMEKTQIPTAREAKERADLLEQRLRK